MFMYPASRQLGVARQHRPVVGVWRVHAKVRRIELEREVELFLDLLLLGGKWYMMARRPISNGDASNNQPASQRTNQPASKPTNKQTTKSANQQTNKPATQPPNQPPSQQTNKSTNQ